MGGKKRARKTGRGRSAAGKMAAEVREGGAPAYGHKGRGLKFYSFEIVIEKEPEDPGYYAYSPTLPGCFSNGRTIEETRRNIRAAIEQHVASLLEHDRKIPQNERVVHVEELTVGVPV